MKIGLVGYQGGGKSSLFQLLTGIVPDPSKVHSGQVGMATIHDERFDGLVKLFNPKKITPAKIELFDTPGLSRSQQEGNAQKLGIIRESAVLVQVIGLYSGGDPVAEAMAFQDDIILADLQVVENRLERLKKDVARARPDRAELQKELEALEPIAVRLNAGELLRDLEFTEIQEKACQSFQLLSRKPRLIVLNTADSQKDPAVLAKVTAIGDRVVAGPVGLELEVASLPEVDREEFASAMGLTDSSKAVLLKSIFEITDLITFFTCDEKEVHAWLLTRGSTALEAAGSIHTDLARGFIRAEIMSVADLLRLRSEREVKAAGLHHVEGKEYIMQDGDEIVVRFSV
ncbi:MAG: DUF933 domain-containing protein [Planctomycetota bacterium]|nr:DUF933 domain-containing protein [Planctomycetota bacterium]MDA1214933.1 DUF933 domain-containing protein [Planctomycetota bacterium]